MYVARQIDPVIADQIADLELLGVSTYPEDRRTMPGGDTGQSVIGRTDIDGNGIAGLELQYGADTSNPDYADFDDILRGVPGEMTLEVAPGGRTIAGTEDVCHAGRRRRRPDHDARPIRAVLGRAGAAAAGRAHRAPRAAR